MAYNSDSKILQINSTVKCVCVCKGADAEVAPLHPHPTHNNRQSKSKKANKQKYKTSNFVCGKLKKFTTNGGKLKKFTTSKAKMENPWKETSVPLLSTGLPPHKCCGCGTTTPTNKQIYKRILTIKLNRCIILDSRACYALYYKKYKFCTKEIENEQNNRSKQGISTQRSR